MNLSAEFHHDLGETNLVKLVWSRWRAMDLVFVQVKQSEDFDRAALRLHLS